MVEDLYRARLKERPSSKTAAFLSSLDDDLRILEEDLDGTEAHNIMLFEKGIMSKQELDSILASLERIREEWHEGKLVLDTKFEDIHELVESRVVEEIGIEIGGKLHTGRSRNDQVAVDLRMRVRKDLLKLSDKLLDLIEVLIQLSEKHYDSLMLLYTHTQHAQVGVYAQYLLSYVDALIRDFERFSDCFDRVNLSPLGACAIGGTSIPINRDRTCELLGFDGLVENSIDAVSSRDFAVETASHLATLMSDLSRISEDLILWSTSEFGYVELSDEFSSTSSVMPQKKNPCSIELVRGKTGIAYGALVNLLTMVKGLNTGYSRDLQETKGPLWASFDAAESSLEILVGVFRTLKVKTDRMRSNITDSYAPAVDLAEALTRDYGLSFREAHRIVGELIRESVKSKVLFNQIKTKTLEEACKKVLGRDVVLSSSLLTTVADAESDLSRRVSVGSPNPSEVRRMIALRKKSAKALRTRLSDRNLKIEKARKRLMTSVKRYIAKRQ